MADRLGLTVREFQVEDCPLPGLDGKNFEDLAFLVPQERRIFVPRKTKHERKRLSITGYGFVQLAPFIEYSPKVAVGIGIIRLERKRLVMAGSRLVQFALRLERRSQISVIHGLG